MLTVWGVMLITLLLTLLTEQIKKKKYSGNFVEKSKSIDPFYAIAIIIVVIYSGLRSSIGDTGYYMYSYKNLPSNFLDIFSQRDWGFTLYQFVIKMVSPHPQTLLVITSLLTISLIFITLRKNSPNIIFSVFLFFVGGTYVTSMNGIRQYLVGALLFYASSLIFEEKKTRFFFVVIIAATIHGSALVMLPIYYIIRQKAWTMRTFLFLLAVIAGFFGFNTFINLLTPLLKSTQYSHYMDSILTDSSQGANILRALVAFVPVFLSFVYRKKLRLHMKYYSIYTNFSLLNFMVIFFASYNWIFARLSIYFDLYNLILLPAIFYYCFDKKTKIILQYVAVCFYLIYFYFDLQPHTYASYYLNINRELIGPLTRSFYN